MTTGMNSRVRSTNRLLSVRLSARANSSPKMFVKIRKPKARISVLTSAPVSSDGPEDLREVVEADEVEVADAGPVGEGVERAARGGDVDQRQHEDDGRQRPPPPAEAQLVGVLLPGLAAARGDDRAVVGRWRRALDGGHCLPPGIGAVVR